MYDRTFWKNHVPDQEGRIIQQGTPMDQDHFNNMEEGISDASLAAAITAWAQQKTQEQSSPEVLAVTLTGTKDPWPFNNAEKAVALQNLRNSTHYEVDIEVLTHKGGTAGHIFVKDKALNGFKLLHDGSATELTLAVTVTGGMLA